MIIERLDVEQAMEQGLRLPWALVRSLSAVSLGGTPAAVDLGELLEASFFSEDREIRLFRREDDLEAVSLAREPEDDLLTERREIQNPLFGRVLTVSHLLEADQDGQTYIAATRMSGWEGAERDG